MRPTATPLLLLHYKYYKWTLTFCAVGNGITSASGSAQYKHWGTYMDYNMEHYYYSRAVPNMQEAKSCLRKSFWWISITKTWVGGGTTLLIIVALRNCSKSLLIGYFCWLENLRHFRYFGRKKSLPLPYHLLETQPVRIKKSKSRSKRPWGFNNSWDGNQSNRDTERYHDHSLVM